MCETATDRRAASARRLLAQVFASARVPFVFRLWDGSEARVGAPGDAGFAVVFPSRAIFRHCLRRPTPLRFGEAYIGCDIDIEGDVFAAMRAAEVLEHLRVPLVTRLRALWETLRP